MNKIETIINKSWFAAVFFGTAILVNIALHFRVFSLDLIGIHVWRQSLTQTVIDNFYSLDFNILNPRFNDLHYPDRIFRMEFPLAQWITALFYKLFGSSLVVTRIVFFGASCFSFLGIFQLIKEITKHTLIAIIGSWCFLFSPILYYYCINPLPDTFALCFSIWALLFWIRYLKTNQKSCFIWSCMFFALSVATKLPFIIYGVMYLVMYINHENRNAKKLVYYFGFPFVFCIPVFIWYVLAIPHWASQGVLSGITENNVSFSEAIDILQFNFLSTFPELLINYATFPLFVIGLYVSVKSISFTSPIHWVFILLASVCCFYFVFEFNVIAKVHDYYLFPFLPVLFIVVAKAIHYILMSKPKLMFLLILAFVICPITAYLRCDSRWDINNPGFDKGYLVDLDTIKKIIPKQSKVIVYGDESSSIVLYRIKRTGWNYNSIPHLKKDFLLCKNQGASFIITHSKSLGKSVHLNDSLIHIIFKKGNIEIYKIK